MTFINYGEITVAQKLLVDPLAVAGSDAFLGGFRYNVTNNALRVADGTIPAVFHGGLGFTADGRLCVQSGAMPITSYVNGLAMNTTGQVLVDSASPPVWSAHGWPISALSKLCVEGAVVQSAVAHFTGAVGQSITTPKTWTPTTQFAIEVQVKYTGPLGVNERSIVFWNPNQPQLMLAYQTTANALRLLVYDATNGIFGLNSATPPPFNTSLVWFRAIGNAPAINFFSSLDRVTWTPMGANPAAGLVSLQPLPGPFSASGQDNYFAFPPWTGDIGRVMAWSDAAMTTLVYDMDPSKWVSGTTFVSGGDTYTLNGGVTIS